jgi:hypothetical protein
VDVITGVIKANIPARIAFQVASRVDSRTILDAMGADKLLGKGDMLYLPPGSAKLIRAQGALITDNEINGIVEFIAKQAKPSYEMEIHQQLSKPVSSLGGESGIDEDEEIIQQCIEVIRSEQKASVSLLQRRLRLGYGRAAGERPRYFFAAAARSTNVLPPFILWASGASLIWITTASASTPRFLTSACVMSRIMPAFCSSVRPAAMLTVISGIVVSPFLFPSWPDLFRPCTTFSIKQDVDARDKPGHDA